MPNELKAKLSDEALRALLVGVIRGAVVVDDVWNGPRSREVGITTKDGRHIVMSVREGV